MNLKSPDPVRRSHPFLTSLPLTAIISAFKQRISYQSLNKLSTERGGYVAFWTGDLGTATWPACSALNFSTNWEGTTFASDKGGDSGEQLGRLRAKGLVVRGHGC